MALQFTTYAQLQAAVGDTLTRPELVADGTIAGFVLLAEGDMRLKLRRAVSKSAFTLTSGQSSKALPATVAELRTIAPAVSVARPKGGVALIPCTWEQFVEKRSQLTQTSTPKYYTVLNGTVYVAPAPDDDNLDFDITTYDALVPVSTSTTLLLEAPQLYYYGTLVHSAPYLEHDERFPLWTGIYQDALEALNQKRQREEMGMSMPRARMPARFG